MADTPDNATPPSTPSRAAVHPPLCPGIISSVSLELFFPPLPELARKDIHPTRVSADVTGKSVLYNREKRFAIRCVFLFVFLWFLKARLVSNEAVYEFPGFLKPCRWNIRGNWKEEEEGSSQNVESCASYGRDGSLSWSRLVLITRTFLFPRLSFGINFVLREIMEMKRIIVVQWGNTSRGYVLQAEDVLLGST